MYSQTIQKEKTTNEARLEVVVVVVTKQTLRFFEEGLVGNSVLLALVLEIGDGWMDDR